MSKMSEIDLVLQEIKRKIKQLIKYAVAIFVIIILAILVYGQADRDIAKARVEQNRLNSIEARLTKQEQYMHEVQAEIDNLKEVHLNVIY